MAYTQINRSKKSELKRTSKAGKSTATQRSPSPLRPTEDKLALQRATGEGMPASPQPRATTTGASRTKRRAAKGKKRSSPEDGAKGKNVMTGQDRKLLKHATAAAGRLGQSLPKGGRN